MQILFLTIGMFCKRVSPMEPKDLKKLSRIRFEKAEECLSAAL